VGVQIPSPAPKPLM